jgi:hypothetical protein
MLFLKINFVSNIVSSVTITCFKVTIFLWNLYLASLKRLQFNSMFFIYTHTQTRARVRK